MKILFIANTVSGLYKDIEREMVSQGHEVVTIQDCVIKYDPALKVGIHIPFIKMFLWNIRCNKYWDNMYKTHHVLNEPFDLLFALSGTSVTSTLVSRLKKRNPKLHTVLYTWDGCDYYDFKRHFPYIERCYTFELKDYLSNKKWRLLPIFCLFDDGEKKSEIKYDLFSVGSNHGGRYTFIKKILPQLKDIKYYIKIVAPVNKISLKEKIYLLLKSSQSRREREDEVSFSQGNTNSELLLRKGLSPKEYMEKLLSSRCVLDDQREGQSGLTARFMWALASNKKIVTTNKWALDYNFVSPKQVMIISKYKPRLLIDFIKSELKDEEVSNCSNFRIDHWVNEILNV